MKLRPFLHALLAAVAVGSGLLATARAETSKSSADEAWQRMQERMIIPRDPADESGNYDRQTEATHLRYRAAGLAFFDNHPGDPRRWEWFLTTLAFQPGYWRDPVQAAKLASVGRQKEAAIATEAKQKWEAVYHGRLVPLFLMSAEPTSQQRANFFYGRMLELWKKGTDAEARGMTTSAEDVRAYAAHLAQYAVEPAASEGLSFANRVNKFRTTLDNSDLAAADERALLDGLMESPHPTLRKMAAGLRRVAALRESPLEMSLVTTTGQPLEMASLRGKVVLVDFWSMGCTGCVAVMPELKRIHEHFRPQGFELVSVCLDYPQHRAQIDAIIARIGASWPTAFAAYDPAREKSPLLDRFAIITVPRMMLLDKSGRLVGTNYNSGAVGHKKLEADIQRLLAAKP